MKKPENNITRKDNGETDMIAFDNPDDAPEESPVQAGARGFEETMVVVDNPDDFDDEGEQA